MNNNLRKAWRSTLRKLTQARRRMVMLEERLATALSENDKEQAEVLRGQIYDLKIRISVLELREGTRRKAAGVV